MTANEIQFGQSSLICKVKNVEEPDSDGDKKAEGVFDFDPGSIALLDHAPMIFEFWHI